MNLNQDPNLNLNIKNSMKTMSFKIELVTQTEGFFDVVAHHAAGLDIRGHDLIVFYIQKDASHSSGTDRHRVDMHINRL